MQVVRIKLRLCFGMSFFRVILLHRAEPHAQLGEVRIRTLRPHLKRVAAETPQHERSRIELDGQVGKSLVILVRMPPQRGAGRVHPGYGLVLRRSWADLGQPSSAVLRERGAIKPASKG